LNIHNRVLEVSTKKIYQDLAEEIYFSFYNHVTEGTIKDAITIKPKHRIHLLKKAMSFINENDEYQINITDIAKHLHTSQRNLQKLFQQYLDTTPKAYLKRKRLNSMYELLLHADPSSSGIQKIFRENGIKHMGNFSKDYVDFFGEYPKDTLKRPPYRIF